MKKLKNMYKAIIIDHDYNILHSASGQIARVFWEYNNQKDFAPTIICSKQNFGITGKCRMVEVEDRAWIRHIGGLFREFGFPDLCHIPDQRYFSWRPFVVRKIKELIKNEQFDYIHSISCPESSHSIALDIKRKTGLPWIAQFNDPWVENEAKAFKSNFFRKLDAKRERLVAENSDLIIHTNKIMEENWINRYGDQIKKKMIVLPLSFNIANLPAFPAKNEPNKNFTIYHIGQLYGQRSAKSFFNAMSILKKRHPEDYKNLNVNFIGGVPNSEKKYAIDCGVNDKVNFLGSLPPEKLETFYLSADLFLVIDMDIYRSPSFPSKLMMYHYFRRPIMSITTKGSIIEDDMLQSQHISFLFNEEEKMVDYLHNAINNYPSLLKFDHDYWKRYSVENVTKSYILELTKILNK